MKLQEIFDKAAAHLLKQGVRSKSVEGYCCYRGLDGLMCAVGALIPDEVYTSQMDSATNSSIKYVLEAHPEVKRFVLADDLHPAVGKNFLVELQNLHDDLHPSQWREALRQLAEQFNLSAEVLK